MRQDIPVLDRSGPPTNPWPWTSLRVTLAAVAHLLAWFLAYVALAQAINASGGYCYECPQKTAMGSAVSGWLFLAAVITAAPATYIAVRRWQPSWAAPGAPALFFVWLAFH